MKNIDAFFLTLSLLCCSFAVSCRQGDKGKYALPRFEKEFTQEFELVGQELDFGGVCSIYPYGDYLLLGAYDARTLKYLHVMDKNTGEIIQSAVHEGRGPGEMLFHPSVSLVGPECYLYDRVGKVTQIYDLEMILQGENGYLGTLLEPVGPFVRDVYHGSEDRTVFFSNESFVQQDSSRLSPRIVLEKGTEHYEYDEYPFPDRQRTWSMYNTPYLTISPDFTKMAVAPAYGGILERFDLSDGISLLGADKFVEPDFDVRNGMAVFTEERPLPICFAGLSSTNDRIFAAMDEKGAWWLIPDGSRDHHMTVVAVFDWDGHPLMRIKNSRHIDSLAYDEAEGVLYAILCDTDGVLHVGKMNIQL